MTTLRIPCPGRTLRPRERALVGALGLVRGRTDRGTSEILETFDGRCARADGMLRRDPEGTLVFTDLDTLGERGRAWVGTTPTVDGGGLPAGPVRERLLDLLGGRAASVVGRLTRRRDSWERRDRRGKVVLRVFVDGPTELCTPTGARTTLAPQIHVLGLQGYEDVFDDARRCALALDGVEISDRPWGALLLEALGLVPGHDPSKLVLDLTPDRPAATAFAEVFAELLRIVRANVEGASAAIDPEFLHDLRVAVRRTRSLLSFADGVIDDSLRVHFADEFRWFGGTTGPLRDLDVYVTHFEVFTQWIEEIDPIHLDPLRTLLLARRVREREQVALVLGGERARVLLRDWQAALGSDAWRQGTAPAARQPVALVAHARVRTAERKLLRLGRTIDDGTEDPVLHELRKRAKKLRYLLEFFGPVLDANATSRRIEALKSLQDNLGEHQDRAVQIATLHALEDEATAMPAPTHMAIELLSRRLDARRRACRAEFADRFAAFDRRDARDDFHAALDDAIRPWRDVGAPAAREDDGDRR